MAFLECNHKQLVEINQSNGICRILLNDPVRKNALSKEMLKCLINALEEIKADERLKVIVIRGADGVFCSGADLQWMKEGLRQTREENLNDAALFYQLFELMDSFPKPIIAWVEKYAMGGALGLLACADYVVADKTVKMAFSEVRLGLVPATIAPFVINKIGTSQARALMLSAQVFSAKKARQIGLIHEIGSHTELPSRIDELCEAFKSNGAQAMASTKHLIQELSATHRTPVHKTLCLEKIAEARSKVEGQEGVSAFFEKRRPNWNK